MNNTEKSNPSHHKVAIEKILSLNTLELNELCDAAEATMKDTYGFNLGTSHEYLNARESLESYFKGVLLVPERILFVGKLDGTICGSIQLVMPSKSNKTSSFAANVDNHFVAPWSRGHGLASMLLQTAENEAKKQGISLIKLSVRANRSAAIALYEDKNYIKWGTLPEYEVSGNEVVPGHFYYKKLRSE